MILLLRTRPMTTASRLLRFSVTSALFASASTIGIEAARAQTDITTAVTNPIATATANNGSPNDVDVTSTGSITLTSGPTAAITVNSNNNASNAGTISITGVNLNNSTGILVTTGYPQPNAVAITNTGTISLSDPTPSTTILLNSDNSGPNTGSLTTASGRYGIQIQGSAAFNGSIADSGTISVLGNDSGAVLVGNGGLTGTIAISGTESVSGTNSFTLQTLGMVLGSPSGTGASASIAITGAISAFGTGSTAIAIDAPVAGQVYIDNAVTSNAYYSGGETTARPITIPALSAHNTEQAGPAVIIGGSIGGGVELDTSAVILTLGSAPALLIGPSAGTAVLSTGSNGDGLAINSGASITANGIYDGFSTTAVQVGGAGGYATISTGAGATAGDFGINNAGTISATSYGASGTTTTATAMLFKNGATSTTLYNSGTISATVNFGAGSNGLEGTAGGNGAAGGTAIAIWDQVGALSSITNTGTISATSANGATTALNLTGNTTGVNVFQLPSGTTTAPSIIGDILFGSGNAGLYLEAGTVDGAISYGSGIGNAFYISNGAQYTGAVTQAVGGALNLEVLSGRLINTSIANLSLSSLTIGAMGEVDLAIDPANKANGSVTVIGAVMISSGAKIGLDFESKLTAPETFTLVTTSAGALSGQPSLLLGDVPYFYVSNIQQTSSSIAIALQDRTFAQAGVPGNAAAYNAIFGAFDRDPGVFSTFNSATSQQSFKNNYQQVLPAYSGGLFEMLASGAGEIVNAQANSPIYQKGERSGAWAQQIGFAATQNSSEAPGYYGGGLGFAFGWESPVSPISTIGYSVAYMRGSVTGENEGPGDQQIGTAYTAGVYWREIDGPFHANASLNAGVAGLNSTRNFAGADFNGPSFLRNATARWTGGLGEAHLGLDYEQDLGEDFYIRPGVSGDYFVLYQGAHGDHNGGPSLDLNYASTTSKQGSATGFLTVGTRVGEGFIWRPELTVGYKEVFGGPADTVAEFASGGSSFSLAAPSQKSGPMAKLGFHAGDKYTDIAFEAGGEDRGDYKAVTGQLVARFNF
jgi:hypothetical protein